MQCTAKGFSYPCTLFKLLILLNCYDLGSPSSARKGQKHVCLEQLYLLPTFTKHLHNTIGFPYKILYRDRRMTQHRETLQDKHLGESGGRILPTPQTPLSHRCPAWCNITVDLNLPPLLKKPCSPDRGCPCGYGLRASKVCHQSVN